MESRPHFHILSAQCAPRMLFFPRTLSLDAMPTTPTMRNCHPFFLPFAFSPLSFLWARTIIRRNTGTTFFFFPLPPPSSYHTAFGPPWPASFIPDTACYVRDFSIESPLSIFCSVEVSKRTLRCEERCLSRNFSQIYACGSIPLVCSDSL